MIVTSTALIKSRVNNAITIVRDLMSGTLIPDKIYFFISEEPHNLDEGIKPHEVPVIDNPRVEFIYTENIGSLRKIVPILKMYWDKPETKIILYDDDFGIPRDSLKNLIDYSTKHPSHACSIAGNFYNVGRDRSKLTEQEKRLGRSGEFGWVLKQPQQVDLLSSGLGLLVKPKFFHSDILEWEKYNEEFGLNIADEEFINYCLAKQNTPRFMILINVCPPALPSTQTLGKQPATGLFTSKQAKAWYKKIMEWRKWKFMLYNEEERFDQIRRNIPLFFTKELKDLLYIGVNEKHFQFKKYLHELKYNITLLEAFEPNLNCYKNNYECIHANITKFYNPISRWDVIMWWHGPEHISKQELPLTLMNIEKMANKLVILGCPWGKYIQGAVDDNPYEVHKADLYLEDLTKLGYSIDTIGRVDVGGSNILAWKVLK